MNRRLRETRSAGIEGCGAHPARRKIETTAWARVVRQTANGASTVKELHTMVKRIPTWPLLALALLASCDKEEAREHQREVTPVVMTPLPAYPAWAQGLIGSRIKADPSNASACRGAFDVVKVRHLGAILGVEVEGWSWLTAAKKPADHIIFVDRRDLVTGAGETTVNRPDVQAAVPIVTQAKVGWHGEIDTNTGTMTALAALPDGGYCTLGSKEIAG
jgi:hypothetical protein